MGEPKALLRLEASGPTLLEIMVGCLDVVADEVLLVGSPGWELPSPLTNWPIVRDRGISAADGVVAALAGARHRFCFVTACDMPFLDPGVLDGMRRLAIRDGRGVMVADAHGPHPLLAIYDREMLPALEAAMAAGERSLAGLASIAGVATLDLTADDRTERERWSAFNINTTADLARARARLPAG
jgi:molybdopterin-guanine dinucleotide biosynthesis protein A